jgi:uncharacterized membrane-anchored protein YitT (DUF2179 family)
MSKTNNSKQIQDFPQSYFGKKYFHIIMISKETKFYTAKRIALITAGAFLLALNVNSFIKAGDLVPGGFTGVALLIQQAGNLFGGANIPFAPVFYGLSILPVLLGYFFIGKKFTLFSCVSIVLFGFFVDATPEIFTSFLNVQNPLLSSVFGGLLNAFAISLCLHAGATSGGTDFIAIFISERFRQDGWLYIFVFNCLVLVAAGVMFDIDKVLYSVIFQYVTTIGVKYFYRGYQQKTLLIITDSPAVVYDTIKTISNHAATSFKGVGQFRQQEKTLIYSVVSAYEVDLTVAEIQKSEPNAFVNVLSSDYIRGNFYYRERD